MAASLYRTPVLLDRERHRNLRLRTGADYRFVARLQAMYLAAVEFAEACKDYPIVFVRAADGAIEPAAVLGLRDQENLFVDAEGRWQGRYVPAYARRYPFVLAQLPGKTELGVCIDEASDRLDTREGEPLFDEQGAPLPLLQQAMTFLEQFQQENQRTRQFCQRLHEAGLLVEMQARADLVDGRAYSLHGFLVVDEKRWRALPDTTALAWFRSGELDLIAMHLLSLSNLRSLTGRVPGAAG